MKRIISVMLAVFLVTGCVLSFSGCGEDNAPAPTESQGAETPEFDYANATADDLLAKIKDQTKLTKEEYIWLVSTLENVAITEDLDLEENITFEAIEILQDKEAEFPASSVLIDALMSHEAPQVRGYVMSYMGGLFGTSDNDVAAVLKLLETEKEPYVLKSAIKAVQNEGNANADVAKFLLNMTKNENAKVRCQAALALGNSWSDEVEGAAEALIALMSDSDESVREIAYEYCGKLHNDVVIEPIVATLNNPDEAKFHSACLDGLLTMWLNYPFHENASEAAYRATFDYYNNVAITEDTPPWSSISSMKTIAEDGFATWKEKATFYNPSEIVAAMTRILQSPDAEWLARNAAMEVIAAHGTDADVAALEPIVNGFTDSDAKLLQDSYAKIKNAE